MKLVLSDQFYQFCMFSQPVLRQFWQFYCVSVKGRRSVGNPWETTVLVVGASRNARESGRKPRKPPETHRKPSETAPETVRFRGSPMREHNFWSYPGINLYY